MTRALYRSLSAAATTLGIAIGMGTAATPAAAAEPGSWTSIQPGASGCNGVQATVALDTNGALTLAATWQCRQALLPAPIGLVTSTADFSTGLNFVSRSDQTITYTYHVIAGNSRDRTRTATETRLVFSKGPARITVFVRTSSEGLALRYELPAAGATVLSEKTAFDLPTDAQLTREPYGARHENQFVTTPVSSVPTGDYSMSMFAQLTNGARVLLAESDVDGGYSGGRLGHVLGTGRFAVKLADAQVVMTSRASTPWRVATIGSTATVVESTLGDDVAAPSKVTDTSWIKPGVAAWPWFDGFSATQRDLGKLKQWADYTSSQGWPYLLVDDGWKAATWNMSDLVSYARDRGVGIMLWYDWHDLDTQAERDAQFTKITGWGVKGVKLDFMNSESQARHRWYDAALADTARYKLMVDLHGSRLPIGVQRTWPQVLTSEAIKGEEDSAGRGIEHVAAIPFTRGALGPADYSPMSFQQSNPNSDAAELALGVLIDSGILLPGGRIADYQARPEAQRWMRLLPTVWDETRYVAGDPLSGAVIARRNGNRWFLGALNRGGARTISYPTTFLGTGTWHAEITNDNPNGLIRTSQVITAGATLNIPAVVNGGHVVTFTKVPAMPTGYRKVSIAGTGDVLDVKGLDTENSAQIIRWPSNDGTNQRFELRPLGGGYTRIVNQNSGKDVVVQSASPNAGAKVIQHQYEANANANDEWLIQDAGGGLVRITNRLSGLYLTAGAGKGDQWEQRPLDDSKPQKFAVS